MSPSEAGRFEIYGMAGEPMLALGPAEAARRLLIVPPLFDEMNRMRRTLLLVMRRLADGGICSALIDLPGTGESRSPIAAQSLEGWRAALLAAAKTFGATHVLTVRGGALLDTSCHLPVMRLAPVAGASLVRTMVRARLAADKEAGRPTTREALWAEAGPGGAIELAGWPLPVALLEAIEAAVPAARPDLMEVAIGGGGIAGSPLWLRAEPGEDRVLGQSLAERLIGWMGE